MEYRITFKDEPKELVDFYNGECFEYYDDENEETHLMIATDIHDDTDSIYKNVRAVLDTYDCEVYYLPDGMVFSPVWVDVERLGE